MRSVSGNSWEEIVNNKRIVEKIKNDFGFNDIVSKIIVSRKFSHTEIELINNKIDIFNPFIKKGDFKIGLRVLNQTLKKNEKILIIGDYDVDGCVSTSLLIKFFKIINANFEFYIPNRFKDGYGASLNLVKKLLKKKPSLIMMVDCGSNSSDVANYLKSKKINSIVIDHHEIYEPYPNFDCLLNPQKESDYDVYNYICSTTLIYFFIDYFIKDNNLQINFKDNLIYVLLSTICDVMPIRNLNKIIS